jgi:hypothetical protein
MHGRMRAHARWLFGIAAVMNFAVGGGLVFLRPRLGPLLGLTPTTGSNVVIANATGLFIAVFGYAYARVALDPVRFRPYVALGILGKMLITAATAWSFFAGAVDWRLPALTGIDVVFALLFWDFLRRRAVTPAAGRP